MSRLSEIDAARLCKIARLFDSPVDTEAKAAFAAFQSVAARCGISVVDALASVLGRPVRSKARERDWSPEPVDPTMPWARKVMLCRDAPQLFNADAREFLANLAGMRRAPSPAQLKWLDDLHARAVRHFRQEQAA